MMVSTAFRNSTVPSRINQISNIVLVMTVFPISSHPVVTLLSERSTRENSEGAALHCWLLLPLASPPVNAAAINMQLPYCHHMLCSCTLNFGYHAFCPYPWLTEHHRSPEAVGPLTNYKLPTSHQREYLC
jgi:hypothetical protein